MASNATYMLKANGSIEPTWLLGCLNLFKERGITIRKLLLLKNGCPDRFSMLEIHFVLPKAGDASPSPDHPFLLLLQDCMNLQAEDAEQTLSLL
jgi:hypothetical protein